jgi:hypothetical protein
MFGMFCCLFSFRVFHLFVPSMISSC